MVLFSLVLVSLFILVCGMVCNLVLSVVSCWVFNFFCWDNSVMLLLVKLLLCRKCLVCGLLFILNCISLNE